MLCQQNYRFRNLGALGKTSRAGTLHKSYTVADLGIERGACQNHKHLFLLKLYGSGGGIRTPDKWIMIPILVLI